MAPSLFVSGREWLMGPAVHKFCIEVQSGAGQGRESSLKARPGGTASSRIAEDAQVAQLVEQGTENPRVGGSNPSLGTIFRKLPARDNQHSARSRLPHAQAPTRSLGNVARTVVPTPGWLSMVSLPPW